MKHYNLKDPEDFRMLEILAYNGAVPLERLPSPAYKYFDQLENLSRDHKQGKITKQELQRKRQMLLKSYTTDMSEHKRNLNGIREYQSNIKTAQAFLAQIEKSSTVGTMAEYAFRCIEALTGEVGFANRQMSKIKEDSND